MMVLTCKCGASLYENMICLSESALTEKCECETDIIFKLYITLAIFQRCLF